MGWRVRRRLFGSPPSDASLLPSMTWPCEAHADGVGTKVVHEKLVPSHQGPDVCTIIFNLDVVTVAVKAAHNSSHRHTWWFELTRPATREEVRRFDRVHRASPIYSMV